MTAALPEGRRGQALAVAITLAGLVLLWFGAGAPAVAWFDAREESLARQVQLAARMRMLAASVPGLRREAEAMKAETGHDGAALAGASDAVAGAGLQQALDDLGKAAGLRIGSAETLPAEAAGAWQAVSVRVTLTAPWPPLVRLLEAIATAPTTMVVDHLQLRAAPRDVRDPDRPVDAAFTVTGWRAREERP